jgi:hypothetical protein
MLLRSYNEMRKVRVGRYPCSDLVRKIAHNVIEGSHIGGPLSELSVDNNAVASLRTSGSLRDAKDVLQTEGQEMSERSDSSKEGDGKSQASTESRRSSLSSERRPASSLGSSLMRG